jgi:hypothetical protein
MTGGERDELVEQAVRTILRDAGRSTTHLEADAFLVTIRGELVRHLELLRRERADPRLMETLARVLGRLYDETESGGRRG